MVAAEVAVVDASGSSGSNRSSRHHSIRGGCGLCHSGSGSLSSSGSPAEVTDVSLPFVQRVLLLLQLPLGATSETLVDTWKLIFENSSSSSAFL